MSYQSGFIAIIGRPNAGKSTLMNAMLQEKVSIMSDKPNTTRNNIAGILTKADCQYVFMDTPGIHKPQQQLGRVLNKNAYTAMEDCDCIGWIVDGTQSFGTGDQHILKRIETLHKPVVLILNKIDCLPREKMMKSLLKWQTVYDFADIVPISALKTDNLEELLNVFRKYLPEGGPLFPSEMTSDHSLTFQLCEIVREKILTRTQQEIPHSVAVVLDSYQEEDEKLYLQMSIIVDKDSQKGILIGKQGAMIRAIRLDAQKEIKQKLQRPVQLDLYVRVVKNWRNKADKIKEFGLDELEDDD
ncbi:MAG: GTPase Era [Catenisphaera adipataccumulans]|jgi:GTP-binding protein Era|uniref:GTPase Era n=1 Tax=Catenisphaera adipataccumulans TaxID=700500 RepID=UPI003D8EDE07